MDTSALEAGLRAAAARVRAGGDNGVQRWAQAVADEASANAPRLTGRMAGSANVTKVGDMEYAVTFGTHYAIYQEKRGDYAHPGGGSAHYLARATLNSGDTGAALIAQAIDL